MILEIPNGEIPFLPTKASGAKETQPYMVSGSLDMFGDITLTGNLVVQQSQHIYLRGPITSSGILVNGDITASSLYIRNGKGNGVERRDEWGRVEIEGDLLLSGVNLLRKIEELERRIHHLETRTNGR